MDSTVITPLVFTPTTRSAPFPPNPNSDSDYTIRRSKIGEERRGGRDPDANIMRSSTDQAPYILHLLFHPGIPDCLGEGIEVFYLPV
jgi:hypothetical protein